MTALVTGIGVVAPNGVGIPGYWASLCAGKSGIGPVTRFDASGHKVTRVGEIDDSALEELPKRLALQLDRWTVLAMTATSEALRDAGIDPAGALPFDEYEIAVVTAASSGGNEFGQREIEALWRDGSGHVSVYQSIAWFYAATTGQLSIRHKLRGPCGVVVGEQAGGLDALGQSRRLLRKGTKAVVTGGTEAGLSPYALACQGASGLFTSGEYRPFDTRADGYVPGEGGAILLVEDAESATARGIGGYGEIAGYAATFDPAPGGLRHAVVTALADARVEPSDVDVVFADGSGIPAGDADEAAVLREVFGDNKVAVTVPKTMTGRAGSSLDVASALLAMRDDVIPPTTGVRDALPGLDLVTGHARETRVATALVLARGFGGFNSALVLREPPARRNAC